MRKRPYSPYGRYLLRDENDQPAGVINDGVYKVEGFKPSSFDAWSGVIHSHANPPVLFERNDKTAVLDGLRLRFTNGRILRLVPDAGAEPDPRRGPRVSSEEGFRLLLDQLDQAEEIASGASDAALAERIETLRRRIDVAAFYECPSCHNAVLERDCCHLCRGEGFVWEGVDILIADACESSLGDVPGL
ncbi:hypothetical protein APB26_32705 [Pseudomonas aeruginosa]|nr:hypothetical protein APB26_32705 [Pseudomonas aeruginosa]RPV61417.1 hypothetical protein IPC838_19045 [Pseudomonas aeruginosa]